MVLAQLVLTKQRSSELVAAVQSGQINADEFRELQMMINRQAQAGGQGASVSGQFGDDLPGQVQYDQAVSGAVQQDMLEAQAQFDQLYQEYLHGDYHPSTYAENGVESREIAQIDSLYEGMQNGSVSGDEARVVLETQVSASFNLGRAQSDGQVSESENAAVHEMVNQAGAQLTMARSGELGPQ